MYRALVTAYPMAAHNGQYSIELDGTADWHFTVTNLRTGERQTVRGTDWQTTLAALKLATRNTRGWQPGK